LTEIDGQFTTADNWVLQKAISMQEHVAQLESLLSDSDLDKKEQ